MTQTPFVFRYVNYRNEISTRRVIPKQVEFRANVYHPEPQWLMLALDLDKNEERWFAMQYMIPVV